MLNSATLYFATACTLKLGDGVRGHVNKALDYTTAPSAHEHEHICIELIETSNQEKEKIIRIMRSSYDSSCVIGVWLILSITHSFNANCDYFPLHHN